MTDQTIDPRREVRQERRRGRNSDTYRADDVQVVYGDGVASVILNPTVTKLELFNVVGIKELGNGEKVEIREVTHLLTIPTRQLVELTLNVVVNLKAQSESLQKAGVSGAQSITTMLNRMELKSSEKEPKPAEKESK